MIDSRNHTARWGVLLGLALVALLALPVSAQEVPTAPPPASSEAVRVVTGTGGDGLSLRDGPGLEFVRLTVLPEGTAVRISDGPLSDGLRDWYAVEVAGSVNLSGYVAGAYLGPTRQSAAAAPVEQPTSSGQVVSAVIVGYADGGDGGAVGSTTASGTRTHWGTVAADIRLYPFGTRLTIAGFEDTVFTVEDTGSAVRGNIFDVWFPDLATAERFGTQRRQVTILPPGT